MRPFTFIIPTVGLLLATLGSCTRPPTDRTTATAASQPPSDSVVIRNNQVVSLFGYDITEYGSFTPADFLDFEVPVSIETLGALAASACDWGRIQKLATSPVYGPELLHTGPYANMPRPPELLISASACDGSSAMLDYYRNLGMNVDSIVQADAYLANEAVAVGNLPLLRELIRLGSPVNTNSKLWWQPCGPLHEVRDTVILQYLLARGVEPTLRCADGKTLLHTLVAREEISVELVEFVLRNELVDPAILDKDGLPAYRYATMYEHYDVSERLYRSTQPDEE